jgi:hypothetical protein
MEVEGVENTKGGGSLGPFVSRRIPSCPEKLDIWVRTARRVAAAIIDVDGVDAVVMQYNKVGMPGLRMGTCFTGRVSKLNT